MASDSSEEDANRFDMTLWLIPALSVHLVQFAKDGFHNALVFLPIAHRSIAQYAWKTMDCFFADLARTTWNRFKATEAFKRMETLGSLRPMVGRHKLTDREIAGSRVIFKACTSERPAFIIELQK